jgi:hypothetical protein
MMFLFVLMPLALAAALWMARPEAVGSTSQAPGDRASDNRVWFQERFESSAPRYGFEWAYPEKDNYRLTHLPTGGWKGSGAGHLQALAGREQYNLGWVVSPLKRTFASGDGFYLRFRIRYDDDYRWDAGNPQNKLIMMGTTRTTPNSRIIVFQNGPNDSFGCTLGQVDYLNGSGPFRWAEPSHFGVPARRWTDGAIAGHYGSIEPYVNISWIGNCAPPALVTYGNNPKPPVPGPNSAAPVDGWYHFQVYAQSGEPGKGAFRQWVNNNTYGKPTSETVGIREGLGVQGWGDQQIFIGGYIGQAPGRNLGFRLDDFEIGPAFDPNWAPVPAAR